MSIWPADRPCRQDTSGAEDYGAAVRVIRHGLLAHLRPATARKVAFANAMKLFELKWPDNEPAALATHRRSRPRRQRRRGGRRSTRH